MAIGNKIPSPKDIKTSPVSFSPEELNELKQLRSELSTITFKLGQLHINEIKLKNTQKEVNNELSDLEVKESSLAKKLSNKYGKGTIDIETGTFTPSK